MPDFIKFPLVLLVVTLVSGTALAYIFRIADPEIRKQKLEKKKEARRIVFQEAGRFEELEDSKMCRTFKGDECIGYVAEDGAVGYSSTVKVLVGVRNDGKVNGVTVLSQQETPGLGTRIEEVKSDMTWLLLLTGKKSFGGTEGGKRPEPWFLTQYKGLSPDEIKLDDAGGAVDAITGATVSSQAVTDAVRGAVEKVQMKLQTGDEE